MISIRLFHTRVFMPSQIIEVPRARSSGRPRSETVRRDILAAAIDLLKEESLQAITIEAIARRAGVSKATIYRWWSSKAQVVIEAFMEHHIVRTPMQHDLHPVTAIVHHWRSLAEHYSGWAGRVVAQILGEGQGNPEVLREFRQTFYNNRAGVVSEVFEQARPHLNVDEHADMHDIAQFLYAPLYARLMWGFPPINARFIKTMPITYFRMLGVELDEDGVVKER